MLALAKNCVAIGVVQENIKVMRLIRKSPVFVKYIFTFLPVHARCGPDGFG